MPRLRYVGIRVTDLDRGIRFYSDVLELELAYRKTMSHGGEYAMLEDPETGQRLELNYYPPDNEYFTPFAPGEGLDHVAFEVDDVAAWIKRVEDAGGKLEVQPWSERPGVNVGYVSDPDGNWLELFHKE